MKIWERGKRRRGRKKMKEEIQAHGEEIEGGKEVRGGEGREGEEEEE